MLSYNYHLAFGRWCCYHFEPQRVGLWVGGEARLTSPVGQESPGTEGAVLSGEISPRSFVARRNDRVFHSRDFMFVSFHFRLFFHSSKAPTLKGWATDFFHNIMYASLSVSPPFKVGSERISNRRFIFSDLRCCRVRFLHIFGACQYSVQVAYKNHCRIRQ